MSLDFQAIDGRSSAPTAPRQPSRTRYLSSEGEWARLARIILASQGPIAIDTEYVIGDDQATAHRAELHVWSIGIQNPGAGIGMKTNARGVFPALAAVLPAEALICDALIDALCQRPLWAHNASVDYHTMTCASGRIARIPLANWNDSLSLARWLYPERVPPFGPGFSLDALGQDLLGYGKTEDFKTLLTYPNEVMKVTTTKTRVCECGARPCHKRGTYHRRQDEVEVKEEMVLRGTKQVPLDTIVPGHERWERLVEYSGRDVLVGCELVQFMLKDLAKLNREVPW